MKKIVTEEQFFILLAAKSCFERRVAAYIELSRVKKNMPKMQGQLLSLSPIVGTIHELRKQLSQTTEKSYKYVPIYIAKKVAPPFGMWSIFPCRFNLRQ